MSVANQPDMRMVHIEAADDVGVDTAIAILLEATNWLISQDDEMWPHDWFTRENMLKFMDEREGDLYLAIIDDDPVGTVILSRGNVIYWTGPESDEALYVNRLAIRRSAAGKGVAKAMLDWCAKQATVAGKKSLRLHCSAKRPKLCTFYDSAGFTRTGPDTIEHGTFLCAHYEMQV